MIDVVIVGEGETEETFVRDLLAPMLGERNLLVTPRLIQTSKYARGGSLSRDRVVRYLRNTLRERDDVYVTTFFDLYGLPPNFPGVNEAQHVGDPMQRAQMIEARFAQMVVKEAGCRADRFVPHIQPYEFEALLFADTDELIKQDQGWQGAAEPLRDARKGADTPEHINDGKQTHPSARLIALLQQPRYDKVLHGTAAAKRIGLDRIREECRHFGEWLARIENLRPL